MVVKKRELGTPTILVRTHLWIWWGEIAVDALNRAGEARRRALEVTPQGESFGDVFMEEARSSMICVSASAHALDALFGAISQIVPPIRTSARWSTILETVKSASRVRGAAGGRAWAREFAWLFDLRDAALHHEEKTLPATPHPTGTNTGVENVVYSLESATRAVDLLLQVLETCVAEPRPPLVDWATGMRPAVERLRERRAPASG